MLRQLRQESGYTLKDAAEWLGMGESGVSKLEKARSVIKAQTIRALGQFYDVDAAKLDYLLRLANEANQRGWWAAYRDTVPEWFRTFVSLEADALDLWNYEAEHVPGLLQTSGYARELLRANRPDLSEDEIERQVRVRQERQTRIDDEEPPRLHFYINEAVIRRPTADPSVWGEQLDFLVKASQLEHVSLRILPFTAGIHPAMAGAFVMMQFPEEDAAAFVYVENERGGIYLEDPGDIHRYTFIVHTLDEQQALSCAESRTMLVEAAEENNT
ncbi:helix-turn-helix transcriptional regulator [Salinifilum aidingensis]